MITPVQALQNSIGKEFLESPSPFMRWLRPVVLTVEPGKLAFQYTIRNEMTNTMKTLHGGVTAAIIDDVIGAALITLNEPVFYVTINNVIDYFAPAKEGDAIIAETEIIKKGNRIANAQCEIWNADKTRLIAKGYSNLLRTEIVR